MLTTYHGLVSYDIGQTIQQETHSYVSSGGKDEILIFQHPNTYTLGRMGKPEDILINNEDIKRLDIEIRNTDRGGEVTYHGPGQLVVYPIIKLDRLKLNPSEYVNTLTTAITGCLSDYNIVANENDMPTGVWVENRKIAAIGVRVSKKTTSHGLALNVTTDLSYFDHIIPCGIQNCVVTSIEKETSNTPTIEEIAENIGGKLGNALENPVT
tara:strand:- start:685 stop:1317 length:633 start_codon:yes stop_codon:yes gene_type:complete